MVALSHTHYALLACTSVLALGSRAALVKEGRLRPATFALRGLGACNSTHLWFVQADTRRDVARAFAKLQSDMIQLQRKKQAAASAEATGKAAQPSSQNPSVAAVVRAFQQGRF